jgi:hypothetical protein
MYAIRLRRRIEKTLNTTLQPLNPPIKMMRQHCEHAIRLIAAERVELHVILEPARPFREMEMQSLDVRDVEDVRRLSDFAPDALQTPCGHVSPVIQHHAHLRATIRDLDEVRECHLLLIVVRGALHRALRRIREVPAVDEEGVPLQTLVFQIPRLYRFQQVNLRPEYESIRPVVLARGPHPHFVVRADGVQHVLAHLLPVKHLPPMHARNRGRMRQIPVIKRLLHRAEAQPAPYLE